MSEKSLFNKIEYSMMKYLWLANPLNATKRGSIPRFLRKVELFKQFSDNELRLLSTFMHHRRFQRDETIFNNEDLGIGFYLIFSGNAWVINPAHPEEKEIVLEPYDYFGELALLQETNRRSATVKALDNCELVGFFKPDLEELIDLHPLIATKFLQSLSVVLADRLFLLTAELQYLKGTPYV